MGSLLPDKIWQFALCDGHHRSLERLIPQNQRFYLTILGGLMGTQSSYTMTHSIKKSKFFHCLGNTWQYLRYESESNNAINNVSTCSVLFLSMTGLFPARRKILVVECSDVFLNAGNNPGVLKNSTEHAETLFIAFRQFPQVNSIQLTTMYYMYAWPRDRVQDLGL